MTTQKPRFQPKGVLFFDNATKRQMLLVNDASSSFNGWLCYQHPDAYWVTLRKATDEDLIKLAPIADTGIEPPDPRPISERKGAMPVNPLNIGIETGASSTLRATPPAQPAPRTEYVDMTAVQNERMEFISQPDMGAGEGVDASAISHPLATQPAEDMLDSKCRKKLGYASLIGSTQPTGKTVPHLEEALEMIRLERARQFAKWGDQRHNTGTWLQILMKEVGEYSEACLHDKFGGPKAGTARRELVQVAAVATQMLERML